MSIFSNEFEVAMERDLSIGRGSKVQIRGKKQWGWGNLFSLNEIAKGGRIQFFRSPVDCREVEIPLGDLLYSPLPEQTRCYYGEGDISLVGRIQFQLNENDSSNGYRFYRVQFPNDRFLTLSETEFQVRSYLDTSNPVRVLESLFHESPFLFEHSMLCPRISSSAKPLPWADGVDVITD